MLIKFKVSENFIKTELLEGRQVKKNVVLDVDFATLPKQTRKLLLDKFHLASENELASSMDFDGNTIEHIISTYARIDAEKKAAAEKQEEEVRTHFKQNLPMFLKNEYCVFNGYTVYSDKLPASNAIDFVIKHADKNEFEAFDAECNRRREAIAEKERFEKEAKAQKEAEEKAKLTALEQGKTILQEWAVKNGSELLKLRIEEQMNWVDLAISEWIKKEHANAKLWKTVWNDDDSAKEEYPIKNASIEQIKQLREMRKQHNTAELVRVKYEYEEYCEDDQRYYHKNFIRYNVIAPNTSEITLCVELK